MVSVIAAQTDYHTAVSLYEVNILISILQMTRVRLSEMKGLAQGHTASKQRSQDSEPCSDQNCLMGAGPSICPLPSGHLVSLHPTKQSSTGYAKPLTMSEFRESPGRRVSCGVGCSDQSH